MIDDDPIVIEVRAVRRRYVKRFDYDIDRIFADLKRSELGREGVTSPVVAPPEGEVPHDVALQRVRFGHRG